MAGNKGREFRQIVVNGDTGAYDGTTGKPMKKQSSDKPRDNRSRERSGDQRMPKRGGRNHKYIPPNKKW